MGRDECRVIGKLGAFGVRVCTCWGEVDRVHQEKKLPQDRALGAPAGMDFHDEKAEQTLTRCRRRVR